MEAVFGLLVFLAFVYAVVAWVGGIAEAIFRGLRGDRTPAFRRAYRYEDSAGADSDGE